MGEAIHPRTRRTAPQCSPCSRAHFGRVATACVSSPRDWAVSIGSHMQHDTDVSKVPPNLGAPITLFDAVQVRKQRSKTLAQVSPQTQLSCVLLRSVLSAAPGTTCKRKRIKSIRHFSREILNENSQCARRKQGTNTKALQLMASREATHPSGHQHALQRKRATCMRWCKLHDAIPEMATDSGTAKMNGKAPVLYANTDSQKTPSSHRPRD